MEAAQEHKRGVIPPGHLTGPGGFALSPRLVTSLAKGQSSDLGAEHLLKVDKTFQRTGSQGGAV